MDLMDMVKGAVTKQVMGKLGGMLGTDEKKTSSAFETAAGSILGGLIKKSGTPQGARDIFDMTQKQDTGVLDKLGDLLGGGEATDKYQEAGGGLLEGIFGGQQQQSGILSTLANFLGLKGGMMSMLMKMVAPIVMGVVAKHVKNKALDAVGLGSFLGEQKKSLGSFMPASLTEGLGFGNLLGNVSGAASGAVGAASDAVGNVTGAAGDAMGKVAGAAGDAGKAVSGAAGDAAAAGGGLLKLLLPLILLGALIFGAWQLWPMLTGAGDAAKKGAAGLVDGAKKGMDGMMPEIPGMDMSGVEGFDFGSLGDAGPGLTKGFGDITSGFAGLKEGGEEGAKSLAEKITGFTGSIDGMGLDKLEGAGKSSAQGLIGKFMETITGLMGGQSDGIKGILQPVIDTLKNKFSSILG